jgi:hypothetical protein
VEGLLVFALVLGSPLLHAPVLSFDLLPGLKRPLDGGATFRGRRLFGDNKTWRGAICMTTGVVLLTLALAQWDGYWSALPEDVQDAGPLLVGLLVGLGVVVGELPNSFLKRQLDIAPGEQRRTPGGLALMLYDQADLVPAIVLLLLPVYAMPLEVALLAFVVVAAVHFAINVIGFAIGARTARV